MFLKRNLIYLFIFGIFMGVFSFVSCTKNESPQQYTVENSQLYKKAKNFNLPTIKGNRVELNDARGKDRSIIFFWTTWCPNCRMELKRLDEEDEILKSKGIKVFLINLGEDENRVRRYIKREDIEIDSILDEESTLEEQYDLIGLPTVFFLNNDGIIDNVLYAFPDEIESAFK